MYRVQPVDRKAGTDPNITKIGGGDVVLAPRTGLPTRIFPAVSSGGGPDTLAEATACLVSIQSPTAIPLQYRSEWSS